MFFSKEEQERLDKLFSVEQQEETKKVIKALLVQNISIDEKANATFYVIVQTVFMMADKTKEELELKLNSVKE